MAAQVEQILEEAVVVLAETVEERLAMADRA
jgi:hypothetical protein